MKKSVYLVALLMFFVACGESSMDEQNQQNSENPAVSAENKVVEIDFHTNKFKSVEKRLLNELDSLQFFNSLPQRIFIEIPKDKRDVLLSEKFFNFLPLYQNKNLQDGFIMTVSGELFSDRKFSTMTNRSFIFERVNNELVLVNSFKGFIKELKKVNANLPSDIVLEFNSENEKAYFYCLYSWKEGKYQYAKCIGFSEDKGVSQIKYTDAQSEEFSPDIKEIIDKENFAF
jgi:hypothetical protein